MLRWSLQLASAVSGAARIALGHTHALTVRGRPPSGLACVQARGYSASAILRVRDGAGAGGGSGINNDEPAAATRVLWAQRAGAKDYAKLVTSAADVGDLKKDIVKELPSLRSVDADRIRLQLAVKDAGGTDKLAALDSMDTIDEALTKALGGAIKPTDKLRIIVDVMAPAAPPLAPLAASMDGEDAGVERRRSARSCAAPLRHRICPALSSDAYAHSALLPSRPPPPLHLQHCVRKRSFLPTCGRP